MTVAIVALNWKNPSDTIECIHSIVSANHKEDCYIVVVDNCSGDESLDLIATELNSRCSVSYFFDFNSLSGKFSPESHSLPNGVSSPMVIGVMISIDKNLGFAGGNNVGLRWLLEHTDTDCFLLLNNDAVIEPYALNRGADYLRSNSQYGLAGCVVRYFYDPVHVQAFGGASFSPVFGRAKHLCAHVRFDSLPAVGTILKEISYPLGAAMFVSRKFLMQVGLMYENYFLYFEEVDWAYRGRAIGYKVGVVADATVFHKEGGTIGSSHNKTKRSLLSEHYLNRARVMFTRKCFPNYLLSTLFYSIFLALRALVGGDPVRTKVILKATWCGLRDAL